MPGAKGGFHFQVLRIDTHHLAVVGLLDPLDHVAVQRLPALDEQALLGEVVLVVQQQDLALGLVVLEVVRHHGRALVRAGRAAEGVGGNHHHKLAAIGHGIQLLLEQLGLRPGLPGVRRQLGGSFVIAFQRAPAHIDAGREHQLVVAQRLAGGQQHALARGIDMVGAGVDHLDTGLAQAVVAMTDAVPGAQPGQVQVGERAGVENLGRLDQGHAHLRSAGLEVARCGGTTKAATDHHHMGRTTLGAHDGGQGQGCSTRQGATQKSTAIERHQLASLLNHWASAWICASS